MTKKGGNRKVRPRARSGSRPVIDMTEVPEGKRRVLMAQPSRTRHKDLSWKHDGKDGLVVIRIRKNFSRFERALRKVAGGPAWLRIPLDRPGSRIWELCDGKRTVLEIGHIMNEEFKEEMEPVLPRVIKFMELLLKRNLIILRGPEGTNKEGPTEGPRGFS